MRLLKTVFVLFMLVVTQQTFAINNQGSDPNAAFSEMLLEIVTIQKKFFIKHKGIKGKIHSINKKIAAEKSVEKKLNLLVEKDVLNDSLSFLSDENENEIIKIKYLKGLNIIRLLYDKSLSLDHHFSSVRTFSEINKMANPNQYPEYANLKELISAKKDKRIGIDLGNILSANTLVSIINAGYPDIRRILNSCQRQVINGALTIDKQSLIEANYADKVIELLSTKLDKKQLFTSIRQLIADSQVKDYTALYRHLYDNVDTFAVGHIAGIILIIAECIQIK